MTTTIRLGLALSICLLGAAVYCATPSTPAAAQETEEDKEGGKKEKRQPPTKEELQKVFMDFLAEEGYKPALDRDGDVRFKVESRTYFIGIDAKDPMFFRLVFPSFWKIDNFEEYSKVLIAAHHASSTTKCAKVFIVKQNVWASLELFVDKPEDVKPLFKRAMSALRAGVNTFVSKMRGNNNKPSA